MTPTQRWAIDALERISKTFVQGFMSVVTLDVFTDLNMGWGDQLLVGLLAGVYALLSAFAARGVGGKDDASLLPQSAQEGRPRPLPGGDGGAVNYPFLTVAAFIMAALALLLILLD